VAFTFRGGKSYIWGKCDYFCLELDILKKCGFAYKKILKFKLFMIMSLTKKTIASAYLCGGGVNLE
ncbi:MAG: hypothetical protein RSB65_08390, partial [Oscillospiraceae bacterium]